MFRFIQNLCLLRHRDVFGSVGAQKQHGPADQALQLLYDGLQLQDAQFQTPDGVLSSTLSQATQTSSAKAALGPAAQLQRLVWTLLRGLLWLVGFSLRRNHRWSQGVTRSS